MPKKRKDSSHCTKEDRFIRTRLLEISLKVENLVYYKKPITKKEAEDYLDEVLSYKTDCYKDERCLQVIDKLTRCMKAIIAEQEQHKLDHETIDDDIHLQTNLRANSVSPVYSLPDEDRTQFSQSASEILTFYNENGNNISDYKINSYDMSQNVQNIERIGANTKGFDKNIEILYYNNEIIGQNQIAVLDEKHKILDSTTNADLKIQKALPNLTITEADYEDELMCIDVDCSQSILKNIEQLQHLNISHTQTNVDISDDVPFDNDVEIVESANSDNKQGQHLSNKAGETKIIKHIDSIQLTLQNSTDVKNFEILTKDSKNTYKLQQTETVHVDLPGDLCTNIVYEYAAPLNSIFKHNMQIEKEIPVASKTSNTLSPKNKSDSILHETQTTGIKTKRDQFVKHKISYQPRKNINGGKNAQMISNNNTVKHTKQTNTSSKNHIILHNPPPHDKTLNSYKRYNNISTDVVNNNNENTNNNILGCIDEVNNMENDKKKKVPRKKILTDKNVDVKRAKKIEKSVKQKNNKTADIPYKRKKSKKLSNNHNIAIPKLCDKKVTNELSWLENIRFVREINEDEYDHKLLIDDNFWNNSHLPANFELNDFI